MYNATNSAPHRPSLHRVDALRTLSLRSTAQLNDLFVTTLRIAPHRGAPLRCSTQCNATICLFLFAPQLAATWLAASRHPATQRFVCYNASPRGSASHRAPRLPAAHLASIQRFVYYVVSPRDTAFRNSTLLSAALRNATICLSIYYRASTRLSATNRGATRLAATRSNSTQRTET
jgi:hypothetical protein